MAVTPKPVDLALLRPDWVLMACSCGCTSESPCRYWRKQLAEQRVEDAHHARLDALLPEDREWLTAHGWTGH